MPLKFINDLKWICFGKSDCDSSLTPSNDQVCFYHKGDFKLGGISDRVWWCCSDFGATSLCKCKKKATTTDFL